jgi:hypothetical protein
MIVTMIGSREAPKDICDLFTELGVEVRERGWWARSGHAQGIDYASECGALKRCIVYLPWESFNRQKEMLGIPRTQPLRDEVLEIVYKHEAYAKNLKDAVKLIKSRNVYQVLGEDLESPSDIVVCWTEEGKVVGGTGLAIKIATANDIPIINVGDPNVASHLDEIMSKMTEVIGG